VTDVSRALRGTLPLITALTVATAFMLPESALAATPARGASPAGYIAVVSHAVAKIEATRSAGPSAVAGSVLRDGVIAVCVLIVAVACLLLGSMTRRRRRAAQLAQPPRARHRGAERARGAPRGNAPRGNAPRGGHARHTRAAIESGTPAQAGPPAGPPARGTAGAGSHPGGYATAQGRPRIVPLAGSGTLGPLTPSQRKKTEDRPPWEPARPPGQATAADAAPPSPAAPDRVLPASLSGGGPGAPGTKDKELPPWEQPANDYAAAPVPADLPDWAVSSSGPMYVWNPTANTRPFPAVPEPGSSQPTEPESNPNGP
jgi:hypothetical protein